MNCLNRNSFKVKIPDSEKQNVKDVAEDLFQSIQNSNIQCSVTGVAMLQFFLQECGVELFGGEVKC